MWGDISLYLNLDFPDGCIPNDLDFHDDAEHHFIYHWLFSCLIWYYLYVFSGICPFWNQVICFGGLGFFFLLLNYISHLYILNINLLSNMICKYFLPFSRLPFNFVDYFLSHVEAFKFDTLSFVYFCFCCLCFYCHIWKLIVKNSVRETMNLFWVDFCVLCKKRVRFIIWSVVFSFHNIIFLRNFLSILYSWHPVAD